MLERQIAQEHVAIGSYGLLNGEMAREAAAGEVTDAMINARVLQMKRDELAAELKRRL